MVDVQVDDVHLLIPKDEIEQTVLARIHQHQKVHAPIGEGPQQPRRLFFSDIATFTAEVVRQVEIKLAGQVLARVKGD